MRLVVLAIVIGFPVALVIAWAFELTPQGLKRTEDVDLAAQGSRKSHVVDTLGAIPQQYYFIDLYGSMPMGQAMLRDPRVKTMVARFGLPAYWREKGWPAGCRPLGERDFECGLDTSERQMT